MYLSEHEDIQEVKDWQEKSVLPGGNVHIWEITWAKKKDAKEKQMADGVRQALGQIARSVVTFRESVSDEHQITSVRPEYPVSIFASIETNNVSSRWVAQRSGFEQKTANIWVLNWQRLEDIIHEKIDHQLLELAEKPTK